MTRVALIFAAAAIAAPASIFAQAPGGVRAVPVSAQAGKVVAGDSLWTCDQAGCATASISARPTVACVQVVRQIGAVSSFVIGNKSLTVDELAKCNARAKPVAALARK